MKNALASLVNLVTLLIGITIGIMLAPHLEKQASAVSAPPAQVPPSSNPTGVPPPQPPGMFSAATAEPIQPTMTVGSIGSYLVLAHHVQADELVVGQFNLLKLQNAELQLLARFVPPSDIQAAVNSAREDRVYQVAPPSQPSSAPPKK